MADRPDRSRRGFALLWLLGALAAALAGVWLYTRRSGPDPWSEAVATPAPPQVPPPPVTPAPSVTPAPPVTPPTATVPAAEATPPTEEIPQVPPAPATLFSPATPATGAGFGPTGNGSPENSTPAEPFGPGSAHPLADGSAPGPEYTIKGNASSMLFHPPSSPYYERTKPEAWFRTAADAQRAGFTEWKPKPRAT